MRTMPDHLSYQYQFKINVIGDPSVGKTSIIGRFVTGFFQDEYKTTTGSQFALKKVPVLKDRTALLTIWDVAGQARFATVRKMYYSGTVGIILVYDVTREESIDSLQKWILEACEAGAVPVVLVGNKADLIGTKTVSSERGMTCAETITEDFGVPTLFFETSALTGQNIDRLFNECAEIIFQSNYK